MSNVDKPENANETFTSAHLTGRDPILRTQPDDVSIRKIGEQPNLPKSNPIGGERQPVSFKLTGNHYGVIARDERLASAKIIEMKHQVSLIEQLKYNKDDFLYTIKLLELGLVKLIKSPEEIPQGGSLYFTNIYEAESADEYTNRMIQLITGMKERTEKRETPESKLEALGMELKAKEVFHVHIKQLEWAIKNHPGHTKVNMELRIALNHFKAIAVGTLDVMHFDIGHGIFAEVELLLEKEAWDNQMTLLRRAVEIVDEAMGSMDNVSEIQSYYGYTVNHQDIGVKHYSEFPEYIHICDPDNTDYFLIIPMEVWNAE